MNLFQTGDFNLHSGTRSWLKIDCDALTDEDLKTIAKLIWFRVPSFSAVEGVPRGGLRLAKALEPWVDEEGPLLIVDDVLTSGGSMEEHRADRDAIGAVIFARRFPPPWITPLFQMTVPKLEDS